MFDDRHDGDLEPLGDLAERVTGLHDVEEVRGRHGRGRGGRRGCRGLDRRQSLLGGRIGGSAGDRDHGEHCGDGRVCRDIAGRFISTKSTRRTLVGPARDSCDVLSGVVTAPLSERDRLPLSRSVDRIPVPGSGHPAREYHLDANGLQIAVHEWGDDRRTSLLLVHGGFDFARTYDVFAPNLADGGWRVVGLGSARPRRQRTRRALLWEAECATR